MNGALLFTLFLLANPVSGEEPYVGRAWLEPGGELCFQLPDGLVDWPALARETLGPAVDRPDPGMLRQSYFEPGGSSHVRFEAPVPSQVATQGWQLLHEDGVSPVQPGRLRGEVRYEVDRELRLLGQAGIFGSACASSPQAKPAFVLGASAGEWRMEEVAWTVEATGGISFQAAGERYLVDTPDFAVPRAKKVLVLRSENRQRPWALISWSPDLRCEKACCEHAFSLLELGPGGKLREISENGYGCDV